MALFGLDPFFGKKPKGEKAKSLLSDLSEGFVCEEETSAATMWMVASGRAGVWVVEQRETQGQSNKRAKVPSRNLFRSLGFIPSCLFPVEANGGVSSCVTMSEEWLFTVHVVVRIGHVGLNCEMADWRKLCLPQVFVVSTSLAVGT